MHKQRLMEHMAEALSAHGFTCTPGAALEGRSGSLYNVPLLAESDQLAVLFDATEENPLTAQTIAALANIASDVGAERGVLCHTASVDNAAKTACAGIVALWDAKTMANLVGHAQLAGITGTTPPAPSFDCPAVEAPEIHSLDELLPPAFSEPEVGTSMDLDALETLDWEPSQPAAQEPDLFAGFAEETFSLDEPATELASFEQPIEAVPEEPTIPRLPVHVSPDEARRAAQERLFAVDSVELVLQPVHLLDYEC